MATLTIRNLNEETKTRLRQRAATNGHSMEEEARQILNRAFLADEQTGLGTRFREMFAEFGDVALEIPPRQPVREPPNFGFDESE